MTAEDSTAKTPTYQASWPVVLGLVGLDYFSTLAYQPSIASEAAGLLAPLATAAVVLLTCLGALPVYAYVAGRANPGQGSFGMLERLIPGWRGKVLVLILLGFAATNFVFTRTLSTADASVHVLGNSVPGWQRALDDLAQAGQRLKPISNNSVWHWFWELWNRQLVTTILLLILSILFWMVGGSGFTRRLMRVAGVFVAFYLLLTAIIIGSGMLYLARHTPIIEQWWSAIQAGEWGIDKPLWARSDPGSLIRMCLYLLPKMALGLSGFEMSMAAVPLIRGERREQTIRTRKLMLTAVLIMSVLLLGSALVTTLLMAPGSLLAGGRGHERAIAAIAHGEALTEGIEASAVNPLFGPEFGTAYDIVTVLVLCLAGASVTLGMRSLLPQFLLRYGMELRWAYSIGFIFHVFTCINLIVTIVFRASVDSQRSAYAVSVLTLMTSAAFASTLDIRRRGRLLGLVAALPPAAITAVLAAMTLGIVIYHPGCLLIAGLFIVAIIVTSLASRWYRAREFRFDGFEFASDECRNLWEEIQRLECSIMVPIHPGGRVNPDDKEASIRQIRRFDREVPLIFVEVIVGDASDFSHRPLIEIQKTPGRYMVRVTRCVSVAHVLFAIAHEFSKVGQPPEIHFGWSDQNALAANLKFLLFGEGNIPFLVNDLLRRHEPDHKKRPRVVIG